MSSQNGDGDLEGDDVEEELEPITANRDFDMGLRLGIASQLGHSGFADRDRYDVFGWEEAPDEDEYLGLYLRNPYARAVVDRPATATWRHTPIVDDGDSEDETDFQEDVKKLERGLDFSSYCERVDRLAGVGEYGLLFFDFDDTDDVEDLAEEYDPPEDADLDNLRGLRVYAQAQVDDVEYGDFGTDRWNEPVEYTVDLDADVDDETGADSGDEDGAVGTVRIHHSRLVVVPSTQLLDDENKARPRLEPVLNPLYDIEKTLGAVAEAAYSSANRDLHLNTDPEKVRLGSDEKDDLKDEMIRFFHQGQPFFRTQGAEVNELGGEVQDPTGLIEAELSAIAAQTGIPKRVLTGDAAGELSASEEDSRRWYARIRERQGQYAAPHIYRASLTRLSAYGLLADPEDTAFPIDWPELFEATEQEIADRQKARSATIANLQQVAPGFARRLATEGYLENGDVPEPEDVGSPSPPGPSASAEEREAFRRDFLEAVDGDVSSSADPPPGDPGANATQYSEGDVVMTPQGIGVVAEVRTSTFEGKGGDDVEATSSSPTYAVGLKDERVGVGFYKASQLEARDDGLDVDVDDPVDDLSATASANSIFERVGLVSSNDFTMPASWRKSDTPARIILLKAWAGMGGQFDCGGSCCKGEMMTSGMGDRASDEFCASMKDEVLGGWEGWRKGG